MAEELKAPITTNFNPPMSFEAQIPGMSWEQLRGECKKISKQPKIDGALATILSVAVFKDTLHKNDPYLAQQKTQTPKSYDCYRTKGLK